MSKITFIGTGAFASALASTLSNNGHKVTMWGINEQEIDDINKGFNSKYFGERRFNKPRNVRATLNLEDALYDSRYIILAVPSAAFSMVIPQIKAVLKDRKMNVINVAKGIDAKSKKFYSDVLKEEFGNNLKNVCTLVGPSFAIEVFDNQLTMVNIVGEKETYLEKVAGLFKNNYFIATPCRDVYGAQLFAALKNTFAIGLGIAKNIFPYKNPEAALLTLAIREINEIKNKYYPINKKVQSATIDFSGIGDTFLTCTSTKSRNFSFGMKIYELGIDKALNENTTTIEGYRSATIFYEYLKDDNEIQIPFLKNIFKVLFENKCPLELLDFLETAF